MTLHHCFRIVCLHLLVVSGGQAATIVGSHFTMFQEYSVAPVFFGISGTPGWLSYLENMKAAATSSGFVNAGDPSTPGYFEVSNGNVPLSHTVVSGPGTTTPTNRYFPTWRGMANPGSVFGAAFADEYGSRLHAPLLIVSNGGPFTITSIERKIYSELYADGGLPWKTPTNLTTWSAARIGVTSLGDDGKLGGTGLDADSYITAGLMSETPVFAFITTGPGEGQVLSRQYDDPDDPDDGQPWPNTLADGDIFPAYFEQWQDRIGNTPWDYRIDHKVNYQVSSTPFSTSLTGDQIDVVPEPSAWGMAVLASFALWRRKRTA